MRCAIFSTRNCAAKRIERRRRLGRCIWAVLALAALWQLRSPAAAETPVPTPTIDRLAAPPTVAAPNQADLGAQAYWLNCQPCHGDQGQGLTDDWRAQYPMEDQYCWGRGCHGEIPYADGFRLPRSVPAVLGPGSLTRFRSAAVLYDYLRVAMPFNLPGTLTEADYLAITAFLLRGHGAWNGAPLTPANLADFPLYPAAPPEETPPMLLLSPTPLTAVQAEAAANWQPVFFLLGSVALAVIGMYLIWRKNKDNN